MILKSVNITTLSLGGYWHIQLLNSLTFYILLRGSGKTILSSTKVRVPRVKGIQRLGGEARVTKYCPAAPMIHGTLHLRLGGGQSVGILRRRNVRLAPCARLPLRTRRWSLAGRSRIDSLYTRSPAGAFSPTKVMSTQTLPRNVALNYEL